MTVEERRQRHAALWQVISDNDINAWSEKFLTELVQKPLALDRYQNRGSVTQLALQ
jgi:trehalose-6-phosphate synthase